MTESRGSSVLRQLFFRPVDVASVACFRILFGTIMAWKIWSFLLQGGVESEYLAPPIHFTYFGFDWVRPLPPAAMHMHFVALGLLALCLILGLFYRIAAPLFFVGYTYTFLLERTYYLNHEYLLCLISLILAFVPAHRIWSLDALFHAGTRGSTTPAWTLWLLRFQFAIPYVFGGIAKLDHDWLRGASVRLGLQERLELPLIGGYLENEVAVWSIVYGGLLFDLLVVPLLLWRRTRAAAFVVATLFHAANSAIFNIGVFPWFMIAGTTLFFRPDWPRRLLRMPDTATDIELTGGALTTAQTGSAVVLLLFVSVQLVVPFRHHLYPGNAGWTGEGDNFAWRMMLHHKRGAVSFYAVNPETRERLPIDVRPMLTRFQYRRLPLAPDEIRQLAHILAARFRDDGFEIFEIHAVALVSLNGRRPQLLIDPAIDLSQQPRSIRHQPYILPLTEPLRSDAWDVPVRDWAHEFPDVWPDGDDGASSDRAARRVENVSNLPGN